MEIKQADAEVKELYSNLKPVVNSMVLRYSSDVDSIISDIRKNIDTMTNKEIQDVMLRLAIESYHLAGIKDLSALKEDCSKALLNEGLANSYNGATGTAAYRTNQSIIDTTDKKAVNIIYGAISNSLKTKLDEVHRLTGVLSNILISRNAEAKLTNGRAIENRTEGENK